MWSRYSLEKDSSIPSDTTTVIPPSISKNEVSHLLLINCEMDWASGMF